ncbi:MAG: hypothetical protein R6V76_10680 [Desulfobacterales bacterium]
MADKQQGDLNEFLKILGLTEEPIGIFYTDKKPSEGFSPKPMELPTREREMKNEINCQSVFGQFSYIDPPPSSGKYCVEY